MTDTTHSVTYEQPLNERIRTLLRLEHLFQEMHYAMQGNTPWHSRLAVSTLLELLGVLERADLKTEFIKELGRLKTRFTKFSAAPNIDTSRLDTLLAQLETYITSLQTMESRIGQPLRNNELLTMVKQRLSIPGGTCSFDLPAYHFWLSQPGEKRHADLTQWLQSFLPIQKMVELLLELIRNSSDAESCVAENGFFQKSFEAQLTPCLLVRVKGAPLEVFPEISGSKHRVNVRFLSFDITNRPAQAYQNIPFELVCCMV